MRLLGLLAVLLLPAAAPALESGAPAPDFALPSTAGVNERLSERRGRVVLLAFWSSRCGSCDRHLRSLARLAEAHAGEGAELLVVSIDRSPEASRALADSLGVPVLLDAGREVADLYRLSPLPVTHLVDRHGHLRTTRREARKPERAFVEASLSALLEE